MIFINDLNITYAIEQIVIYQGKIHDELMYAEISEENGLYVVRWEDAWNNPATGFPDLDAAKEYITLYYNNHTPFINGRSYDIEEY